MTMVKMNNESVLKNDTKVKKILLFFSETDPASVNILYFCASQEIKKTALWKLQANTIPQR